MRFLAPLLILHLAACMSVEEEPAVESEEDLVETAEGAVATPGQAVESAARAVESPSDLLYEIRYDTLILENGPADLGPTVRSRFARLADGRFVGGPAWRPGVLLVWSAKGDFEGTIGASGRGPGEFGLVAGVYADGDTIVGYEPVLAREVFVDGRHVDSRPPTPTGMSPVQVEAGTGDGTLLISGFGHEPDMLGYPVHLLSSEGRHLASFGARTAGFAASGYSAFGVFGRRGNRLWAGQSDRYRFEEWDLESLERIRAVERDASFMPQDLSANEIILPSRQEFGVIMWLRAGPEGYLWVGIRMPERLGPTAERREGSEGYLAELSEKYDFRIEVIDPVTGRVVAVRDIPGYELHPWLDPESGVAFLEDPVTTVPTAAVLTPRLMPIRDPRRPPQSR